jgi:hypothetical protein
MQVWSTSDIQIAANEWDTPDGYLVGVFMIHSLIAGLNKAVIYNCYPKYESKVLAEFLKPRCQF